MMRFTRTEPARGFGGGGPVVREALMHADAVAARAASPVRHAGVEVRHHRRAGVEGLLKRQTERESLMVRVRRVVVVRRVIVVVVVVRGMIVVVVVRVLRFGVLRVG